MPWWSTCVAILVASSLSSSGGEQGPTTTPASHPKVEHVDRETEECVRRARDNERPMIAIAIDRVTVVRRFAKVAVTVENLTALPIWMNLRPHTLGGSRPDDLQLFVAIHAQVKTEDAARTSESLVPPGRDDYGVIAPHMRHQLTAVVAADSLDLRPGR